MCVYTFNYELYKSVADRNSLVGTCDVGGPDVNGVTHYI